MPDGFGDLAVGGGYLVLRAVHQRFVDTRDAGCELADFAPFPDHGTYDEGTLRFLADRAALFGAGLVTTEKDWVRLPPAWRAKVTAWPVKATFDDPAAIDALLAGIGL